MMMSQRAHLNDEELVIINVKHYLSYSVMSLY